MTIQRFDTGPRMSQVVVHGNTVYLAGVVARNNSGNSMTEQTKEILSTIDGYLAKDGSHLIDARRVTLPDGRRIDGGSEGDGGPQGK